MPRTTVVSRKEREYENTYATFVDDLGGFLWHVRSITGKTWEELAKDLYCAPTTLSNLANRITKNPQGYTMWKILRGLDNRNVIQHSMLERYRPLTKETATIMRNREKQ